MKKCYPTIVIEDCPKDKASEYFDTCIQFARENDIQLLIWYMGNNACISFKVPYSVDKDGKIHGLEEMVWKFKREKFPYDYIEYSSKSEWDEVSKRLMNLA